MARRPAVRIKAEIRVSVRIVVFLGPEERGRLRELRATFSRSTTFIEGLTIPQLAAALARLSVFITNDTGPMHIAAAVGTSVTLLLDKRAPDSYLPVEGRHRIVSGGTIDDITTDEVYAAARELLVSGRTATLFAS